MSSIFQEILSLILLYRYPTLFFVSFVSSIGIPLPAAATTVAAAAFAGQGYLNTILVIIFGLAGNVLGDLTMYSLTRFYGKKVLYFLRLRKLAESPMLQNVEVTVENYRAPIIIASRFQDQATTIVNIISGLGKMRWRRFITFIIIGDVLQILFYVTVGTVFIDNWQTLYGAVNSFGWIILLVLAIAVILLSTRMIRRHLRKKQEEQN